MLPEPSKNRRAPLLCWDLFAVQYNSLMQAANEQQESVRAVRELARNNKWSREQLQEAIDNMHAYVVVVTDKLQRIAFTGQGFFEMTGYSGEEAKGRNPKFLQGAATNRMNTGLVKQQLNQNEPSEIILENYRKNGELYLCKILIKPVFNMRRQLVNYIAYEQEIAA